MEVVESSQCLPIFAARHRHPGFGGLLDAVLDPLFSEALEQYIRVTVQRQQVKMIGLPERVRVVADLDAGGTEIDLHDRVAEGVEILVAVEQRAAVVRERQRHTTFTGDPACDPHHRQAGGDLSVRPAQDDRKGRVSVGPRDHTAPSRMVKDCALRVALYVFEPLPLVRLDNVDHFHRGAPTGFCPATRSMKALIYLKARSLTSLMPGFLFDPDVEDVAGVGNTNDPAASLHMAVHRPPLAGKEAVGRHAQHRGLAGHGAAPADHQVHAADQFRAPQDLAGYVARNAVATAEGADLLSLFRVPRGAGPVEYRTTRPTGPGWPVAVGPIFSDR